MQKLSSFWCLSTVKTKCIPHFILQLHKLGLVYIDAIQADECDLANMNKVACTKTVTVFAKY